MAIDASKAEFPAYSATCIEQSLISNPPCRDRGCSAVDLHPSNRWHLPLAGDAEWALQVHGGASIGPQTVGRLERAGKANGSMVLLARKGRAQEE
jgi:hypothetical protein